MLLRTLISALFLSTLVGCGEAAVTDTTASYDPAAGSDTTLSGGKADGLIDLAPRMALEDVVSGQVGGDQLDIYKIDLRAGDRFKALLKVESGDLNPHVLLFRGTQVHIHSEQWDLTGPLLVKDYRVDFGGHHLVVVKAFRGQGKGKYSLSTTCTGGPCNGEFVDVDPDDDQEALEFWEKSECIEQTRLCAYERVTKWNGAVGDKRAAELWDECLQEAVLDHGATSCHEACIGEDEEFVCNDMRDGLKFYADATQQCRTLLNDCMEACTDIGDDGMADEFWGTPESICWANGFNGNCDSYARDHAICGGTEINSDTHGECYAWCETTSGAWMDDLDVICDEECDFHCDDVWDDCHEKCGPDSDDCAQNCVDFEAPLCL